jgi:hypothetical protein
MRTYKRIKTIRVNEDLNKVLADVPKGVSYADFLMDKIERLRAHEKNAVCWVVRSKNTGPNRMSVGDRNGISPIFEEVIYITKEVPRTISNEVKEKGWLGQMDDISDFSHGGFASVDAAETYIQEYMGGRPLDPKLAEKKHPHLEYEKMFTTAKFKQYLFVDQLLEDYELPEGTTQEDLEALAKELKENAAENGWAVIGDIDDIIDYLKNMHSK